MKNALFIILFLLLGSTSILHAQTQPLRGIVYDLESKFRLSKVYIFNTRSEEGVMNNALGEFSLSVEPGDILIAASEGFRADTIHYSNQNALIFKLKSFGIRLKPVTVRGIRKTPKDQYEEKLEEYRNALSPVNVGVLDGPGAGLNVDALFGLISKKGRNARMLQNVLERNYRDAIIDYKFTKEYVKNTTKIKTDKELEDFMFQYRPSYYFILYTTEYDLAKYIHICYDSYIKKPKKSLPQDLPEVELPKP